ncbi:MAG: carbohydrate-binding family 9-like protein [Bacteroidales bacterium]|nr:carbohydrate-binding family 9-like protein [Bacteroidales bacterium]
MRYCKYSYPFFLLFLTIAAYNMDISAQTIGTEPGSTTVKKCQDFKISGDGSSDNWKSAEWLYLSQREQNTKPYQTKVKVLYSGTGIYFLFECEDKKLTSTMKADNMDLWNEDVVEVFLWTDESFPVYFEYEISPLNYELPIMVPNYKGKFLGWLPWHYEGERKIQHATSAVGGKKESGASVNGWIAEFFIPFKLLAPLNQVPPVSGTKWRANMYRIDYDNGATHFTWQKTTRSFHEYNNFGTFIFE